MNCMNECAQSLILVEEVLATSIEYSLGIAQILVGWVLGTLILVIGNPARSRGLGQDDL